MPIKGGPFIISQLFLDTLPENSQEIVAKSESMPDITDIDGNIYSTIMVGSQQWMTENLRVTRYRSGGEIENKIEDSDNGSSWFYYKDYNDDSEMGNNYGKLYSWHVINHAEGLCPAGWHIPTDSDWQNLIEYLDPHAWGNRNILGTLLKSCRQVDSPLGAPCNTSDHPRWEAHSERHGTDAIGFGALPGGVHRITAFENLGTYAYFWSQSSFSDTHAWARILLHSHMGMSQSHYNKNFGMSVRCVKTDSGTTPTVFTLEPTMIEITQAVVRGEVNNSGGLPVSERGLLWDTIPTIDLDHYQGSTSQGSGIGTFNHQVIDLIPATTYYVRAWARNDNGVAYGSVKSFTLLPEPTLPQVSTTDVLAESPIQFTATGEVTHAGHLEITARGLVYGRESGPDIVNNMGYTIDQGGLGEFLGTFSPVWAETTYFVRAYATNDLGTAYGEERVIQTPDFGNCGTITDIDGNSYKTVLINEHCFMRENLRTGRFQNGDIIANIQEDSLWKNTNSPAWVNYNNNPAHDSIFGKLYNWYAVSDSRGLCPQGWRVVAAEDFNQMSDFLGGAQGAGAKIKQSMNASDYQYALWLSPNTGATNESGFTALPHGYRLGNGFFGGLGTSAYFRTATSSTNRAIQFYTYYDNISFSSDLFDHGDGDAVRCIKIENE